MVEAPFKPNYFSSDFDSLVLRDPRGDEFRPAEVGVFFNGGGFLLKETLMTNEYGDITINGLDKVINLKLYDRQFDTLKIEVPSWNYTRIMGVKYCNQRLKSPFEAFTSIRFFSSSETLVIPENVALQFLCFAQGTPFCFLDLYCSDGEYVSITPSYSSIGNSMLQFNLQPIANYKPSVVSGRLVCDRAVQNFVINRKGYTHTFQFVNQFNFEEKHSLRCLESEKSEWKGNHVRVIDQMKLIDFSYRKIISLETEYLRQEQISSLECIPLSQWLIINGKECVLKEFEVIMDNSITALNKIKLTVYVQE